MTTIVFEFDELYKKVERSLSVIGKRSTDDEGKPLFADITLGSNEKEIAYDYLTQAVIAISDELAQFLKGTQYYLHDDENMVIELPDNHNTAADEYLKRACQAYCVSYTLYSWFTVTAPRLASKYLEDCNRQIGSIVRLCFVKSAPKAPQDTYADITGTITKV